MFRYKARERTGWDQYDTFYRAWLERQKKHESNSEGNDEDANETPKMSKRKVMSTTEDEIEQLENRKSKKRRKRKKARCISSTTDDDDDDDDENVDSRTPKMDTTFDEEEEELTPLSLPQAASSPYKSVNKLTKMVFTDDDDDNDFLQDVPLNEVEEEEDVKPIYPNQHQLLFKAVSIAESIIISSDSENEVP